MVTKTNIITIQCSELQKLLRTKFQDFHLTLFFWLGNSTKYFDQKVKIYMLTLGLDTRFKHTVCSFFVSSSFRKKEEKEKRKNLSYCPSQLLISQSPSITDTLNDILNRTPKFCCMQNLSAIEEVVELKKQLQKETNLRKAAEEEVSNLKNQLSQWKRSEVCLIPSP